PLTGERPDRWLVDKLATFTAPQARHVRSTLATALDRMTALSTKPIGDAGDYDAILDALRELPVEPRKQLRVLHVDLVKPARDLRLGRRLLSELAHELPTFLRISARRVASPELATFARRFEDRFGDAEVPLLLALDPEYGVGLEATKGIAAGSLIHG